MKNQLIDRFNRNLNYLRVSITDRCNLRCMYCVPPRDHLPWIPHEEILRYEEILRVVRVGVGMGISKIRITGGEPLVRKDVYGFLEKLGRIDGITDISLTTNAVLLGDNIDRVRNAGIRRLNISLDTLDRKKYRQITGRDVFPQVWDNILQAHEAKFQPIKINTVAMKGINDDEFEEIAGLSLRYPFHIRFIEYMPIGDEHLDRNKHILAPEIMARIRPLGELVPVAGEEYDGPAERYRFKGAPGEIGFIRPLSHHFCNRCNRLRLTASGELRPCLLSDRQEDVKGPLRRGCSDSELEQIFLRAVGFKPREHHLDDQDAEAVRDRMSSIGG